jgi:hypothetical protein
MRRERLMPPRWLRKTMPPWRTHPVNCATGAPAVPALVWFLPDPTDTTQVRFGSSVSIRREDGREQTFRIVGEDEADPARGTISHVSPLARSLIGKGVGEVPSSVIVKWRSEPFDKRGIVWPVGIQVTTQVGLDCSRKT